MQAATSHPATATAGFKTDKFIGITTIVVGALGIVDGLADFYFASQMAGILHGLRPGEMDDLGVTPQKVYALRFEGWTMLAIALLWIVAGRAILKSSRNGMYFLLLVGILTLPFGDPEVFFGAYLVIYSALRLSGKLGRRPV